jgi:hypothetical protein
MSMQGAAYALQPGCSAVACAPCHREDTKRKLRALSSAMQESATKNTKITKFSSLVFFVVFVADPVLAFRWGRE